MDRASLLSGHGAPGSSVVRGSSASVKSGSTMRRGSLFAFDTDDTLHFRRWKADNGDIGFRAVLKARNRAEAHVAFKCKTNKRERYRVDPNRFLVKGGLETAITLTVEPEPVSCVSPSQPPARAQKAACRAPFSRKLASNRHTLPSPPQAS